jgi:hypothetical protein
MFAAALLALTLSACAGMRGVQVGTDPGQIYAVEVHNSRGGTVSVSYSAGGAAVALGTISSGQTERYVIPVDEPMQITIVARTSSGASAGNYPVALQAGVTKRVTVR